MCVDDAVGLKVEESRFVDDKAASWDADASIPTQSEETQNKFGNCIVTKMNSPKNHGISKLVVWRSQNPAIEGQTPL